MEKKSNQDNNKTTQEEQVTNDTAVTTLEGADKIIYKYASIAVSTGFIPVPVLDLATLGGIQLKMIKELGSLYNVTFSENAGKSIVMSACTTLSTPSVAAMGASVLKVLPFVGSALGSLTFHAYAAASTFALGKVLDQHFASGGTLLNFNAAGAKQMYKDFFNSYKSKSEEEKKAETEETPA